MCILLKLDYSKFGVSNLFFQKLSKKNLWGVGSSPLGKGRVKTIQDLSYMISGLSSEHISCQ